MLCGNCFFVEQFSFILLLWFELYQINLVNWVGFGIVFEVVSVMFVLLEVMECYNCVLLVSGGIVKWDVCIVLFWVVFGDDGWVYFVLVVVGGFIGVDGCSWFFIFLVD